MASSEPTLEQVDPRVRLAAERTLLAWIRTGLTLMAFGFVVARSAVLFRSTVSPEGEAPIDEVIVPAWLGITILLIGISTNLFAAWDYMTFLGRLKRGEANLVRSLSMAPLLAVLLGIAGAAVVVHLVPTMTD